MGDCYGDFSSELSFELSGGYNEVRTALPGEPGLHSRLGQKTHTAHADLSVRPGLRGRPQDGARVQHVAHDAQAHQQVCRPAHSSPRSLPRPNAARRHRLAHLAVSLAAYMSLAASCPL